MTVASRSVGVGLVLTALLFALLVWSVGTGEISIPPGEVVATLFGGGDLTGLHLGTVWKHSLINEIIEGGVKGKGPHDP